jgi:hypothetical protein
VVLLPLDRRLPVVSVGLAWRGGGNGVVPGSYPPAAAVGHRIRPTGGDDRRLRVGHMARHMLVDGPRGWRGQGVGGGARWRIPEVRLVWGPAGVHRHEGNLGRRAAVGRGVGRLRKGQGQCDWCRPWGLRK